MARAVEELLLNSHINIPYIVLKSDGMAANAGIPKKVRRMLKAKYESNFIKSDNW